MKLLCNIVYGLFSLNLLKLSMGVRCCLCHYSSIYAVPRRVAGEKLLKKQAQRVLKQACNS